MIHRFVSAFSWRVPDVADGGYKNGSTHWLYREAGLAVRKRKKRYGIVVLNIPLDQPCGPNEV